MSDDLIATLTFRNKRLRDAMAGRTAREIGLVAGCPAQTIYGYGSLRVSPYKGKTGDLAKAAKALCNYFELSAEELFPPTLYSGGIPSKVERSYNSAEVLPLLAARGQQYLLDEGGVDREKMSEILKDKLGTLTPRQERAVKLRYGLDGHGEHTLEEIGDAFGLHRESARQILTKALRRMRQPSRSRDLRPYIDFENGE